MKRATLIAIIVVAALGLIWLTSARLGGPSQNKASNSSSRESVSNLGPILSKPRETSKDSVPTKEQWARMSSDERFALLEKLGYVPEFADMPRDWLLAEKTTWWGKPIDPKVFWAGRVIWLDKKAESAARARGRGFPPIPFDDPTLPIYRDAKEVDENAGTVEGPNLHFHSTSKEGAFWTKFFFSNPHPPEDIEAKQQRIADIILEARFDFEKRGNPTRTNSKLLAEVERSEINGAVAGSYPAEAFTDDALFWAYVLKTRTAYQTFTDPNTGQPIPWATNFLNEVVVPTNYISQPLTSEQVKAANAWKGAYLRRLHSQKIDESYINAYLQAWNLSTAEVFGQTNR